VLELRIGLGTTDNGGNRNNSKIIKGEEGERNITIEGQIPPNKERRLANVLSYASDTHTNGSSQNR
jgi:hypothetical protein